MVPRWRSENFASFKTMVEETKQNADGATVLSMLTGDFLRWVVEHNSRSQTCLAARRKIPSLCYDQPELPHFCAY